MFREYMWRVESWLDKESIYKWHDERHLLAIKDHWPYNEYIIASIVNKYVQFTAYLHGTPLNYIEYSSTKK